MRFKKVEEIVNKHMDKSKVTFLNNKELLNETLESFKNFEYKLFGKRKLDLYRGAPTEFEFDLNLGVIHFTELDFRGISSFIEKINNKLAGIKNADLLFGDFDAILKLNMPKIHDIENAVMEEIQMIEGVESTLTLLCVDEKILE